MGDGWLDVCRIRAREKEMGRGEGGLFTKISD